MFKQTFSAVFLCVCFGAFSCTDKSSGFFGDDVTPPGNGTGDNGNTGGDAIGGQDQGLVGGGTQTIDADSSLDTVNPNGDPDNPPEPVPEPMTMLLFGSGLASVAYRYRRRKEVKEEGEAANG